ncbi:MAG: alpha/beta fold hydrolase [Gemmatimonadetes bacterium]|nr:alpha/beta fold hydrolase [Gemmatimonadota bacterium]
MAAISTQETVRIREGDVHLVVVRSDRGAECGRPALLLHGLGARGRTWYGVAERFVDICPQWECWVPDLLGRGASVGSEGSRLEKLRYGIPEDVRRLGEMSEVLWPGKGIPRLIAGHSHGAALAMGLASAANTGPVQRALLLCNPVTHKIIPPAFLSVLRRPAARRAAGVLLAPLQAPLGRFITQMAAGPRFRVSPGVADEYSRPYDDSAGAAVLMKIMADWQPAELEGFLPIPGETVSAHVVGGPHDRRIPLKAATDLARMLSCPLTVIPDGGHLIPEQHPALLAGILRDLAGALEGGSEAAGE